MFFFSRHKIFQRVICVVILVLFLCVTNFALFEKQAQAQVGGMVGAMAGGSGCISTVITATPIWGKQMAECANQIMIGIWKASIFPFLKRIVLNLVLKGDFGLTWDSVKDWIYQDLVFQTIEQVLKQVGLSLCARLSVNLRLALYQTTSPDYYPKCTYQQSEIAQVVGEFIKDPKAGAQRLRRDFFGMFYFSTQPSYNQFGQYWLVKDIVAGKISQQQNDIKLELMFSNGFLGTRDCKDKNGDGRIDRPQECTVTTPGKWVADRIVGDQAQKEQALFTSQALADLGALSGEVIDLLANRAITGLFNDLNDSFRSQVEDAEKDRIKALEKEKSQNQAVTGGNRIIEH